MKKDGFSEIYDVYFPKLLRFTQTYLISEDESENIVQEIFIYLWEHRDIIETLQNLNAYLFTLAKNRCIDYFRKEMVRDIRKGSLSEIENRELQLKLYSLEAFDNDRLSDADIEEILNNAINRLPERCREIFIMSRLQNLRYKEIAIRLNVSPNTVENQIVIALRKLKEELKDYFPLFVFII
ncbi:RNA polymerase sigma-70 factor [Bacteroides fragilis]|uniref:RNA polymerase sigma-70 factor n=1 Tax=Bacteroides fragilis TaxID=817 RepID=UPI0020309EB2|nr:RNA polymerase sigma-70 factor [Bacteroides fragilis]MCM0204389.1 RNA polymerase sigma-70 factor [Bacteroides fragilis]MCM0302854.1 RNA polymerase sigma-70 factor [Bacteroides fragilis]